MQQCKQCQSPFEVTDKDREFYKRISPVFGGKRYLIPEPTLCPDCRRQRRLSFRNERTLYNRKCDHSGRNIISIYSPESPHTVYASELWWSDQWDSLEYGMEFDFSRPFFEQFHELQLKVPRLSHNVVANENCDYVNHCGYSKNCYLCYNTDFSEGCYYCSSALRCKDSIDLLDCENCELCYDSINIKDCYSVFSSENCKNCDHVFFSRELIGCSDCFGCINLRKRKYCFFNVQCGKDEYFEKLQQVQSGSYAQRQKNRKEVSGFFINHPRKYAEITQCENSTGDYLSNCKNTQNCYDSYKNQDIAYCTVTSTCKDTYDFDMGGYDCELCYEVVSSGDKNARNFFCANQWGNDENILYSDIMMNCSDCFGCIGLRHKEHCILNRRYSKKDYEMLLPKIIEHMKRTGEWGEFFPSAISPFGYNETVAMQYFPITRNEAPEKGFRWSDYEAPKANASKTIPASRLPDNIKDIPDDITNWAINCEKSGRPFKIIAQELKFYHTHNLPIPHLHPNERYKNRMEMKNPRKLFDRTCANCSAKIQTTYSPDRPEKVYCEQCYLKEVY